MKIAYYNLMILAIVGTSTACCIFDGKLYENGDRLPGVCFDLRCCGNEWKTDFSISRSCKRCQACNDPHFKTFDGVKYDFHGTCNYSMTQELSEKTFEPQYGIFGDFKNCGRNGRASCLDATTYKADEHTILEVTHSNKLSLKINGEPYRKVTGFPTVVRRGSLAYPLIVWDDTYYCQLSGKCRGNGNCLHVQGPTYSLLICQGCIYIWTSRSYKDHVGGLCGLYSGDKYDDFTHRTGAWEPLKYRPIRFPMSWMAWDQRESECTLCHETAPDTHSHNIFKRSVARNSGRLGSSATLKSTTSVTSTPSESTTSVTSTPSESTSTPSESTTSVTSTPSESTSTPSESTTSVTSTPSASTSTPSESTTSVTSTPSESTSTPSESTTSVTSTPSESTTTPSESTTSVTSTISVSTSTNSESTTTFTSTTPSAPPNATCEEMYYQYCYDGLKESKGIVEDEEFYYFIEICTLDACANPDEVELWVANALGIAFKEVEIQFRTREFNSRQSASFC